MGRSLGWAVDGSLWSRRPSVRFPSPARRLRWDGEPTQRHYGSCEGAHADGSQFRPDDNLAPLPLFSIHVD